MARGREMSGQRADAAAAAMSNAAVNQNNMPHT
jgi:hypothetical protein